jgi:hypothetical protein
MVSNCVLCGISLFYDAVDISDYIEPSGRKLLWPSRGTPRAFAWRDRGKPRKTPMRIAIVPAEIRIEPFPDISVEHNRYTILLGNVSFAICKSH